MNPLKMTLFCFSLLTLTGCAATAKENFDCKYGKGVGCRSITEVNGMVNQGTLGKTQSTLLKNSSAPMLLGSSLPGANGKAVQRVTEEHLKLWIAPFQDKQGNFHEGAIVHTVLKPGFWQVQEGV